MLRFLKKMTLDPKALSAEDGSTLVEHNISSDAAKEAIGIAFAFNLIDRLADSFLFDVPSAQGFEKMVPMMLKHGYG